MQPGGTGGGGTTTGRPGSGGNGRNAASLDGPAFPFASLSIGNPIFAWLGTTAGGILLFLFLVRRRPRENSPSLATFVFDSHVPVAPRAMAPPPPVIAAPPAAPASSKTDSKAPKKTAARKAAQSVAAPDALAASSAAAPSAFAKRPAKGVERVFVSYQGVRMASVPDEFSPMLARLERGDEVEIIGSHEGYLNVRTPIGLTGWIPRVTVTGVRPSPRGGSSPAVN